MLAIVCVIDSSHMSCDIKIMFIALHLVQRSSYFQVITYVII